MKIELLYFDGCPGHQALLPRVQELIERGGIPATIELRRIDSIEQAERERFLGSPTLRINGQDVEPSASTRSDFGLKCRLYAIPEGQERMPSDELVLAGLTATGARTALKGSRPGVGQG